jgi:DNA-binding GntR family transcriptional regulator
MQLTQEQREALSNLSTAFVVDKSTGVANVVYRRPHDNHELSFSSYDKSLVEFNDGEIVKVHSACYTSAAEYVAALLEFGQAQ